MKGGVMKAPRRLLVLVSFVIAGLLQPAYADFADPPAPLKLNKLIDLSAKESKGKTFFEVVDKQIKPLFDADENGDDFKDKLAKKEKLTGGKFRLADKETIKKAMSNFEDHLAPINDRPYARALNFFKKGEAGFDQLIEALKPGTDYNPATFRGVVFDKLKDFKLIKPPKPDQKDLTGMAASTSAALLGLASQSGTAIVLNNQTYFYGLGYRYGDQLKDEKTGRNFAASVGHKSLDPSDKFYLNELEDYLNKTDDPSPFYRIALKILLKTEVDGYHTLDGLAQTVLADCLTIYIAELDRHLMSNLAAHEWENDLFEVTLLAAYSGAPGGKIATKAGLHPGHLAEYYYQGPTGGGIGGAARFARRKLQAELTKETKKLHTDAVEKLERLTQIKADNDVIMGLMRHLNNRSTQDQVKANSDKIVEAMTTFVTFLHKDARNLTDALAASGTIKASE
jgi:hypothetical protein